MSEEQQPQQQDNPEDWVLITVIVSILLFLLSSCSTVNINCRYFKEDDGRLVPVCVEEWKDYGPIRRERQ